MLTQVLRDSKWWVEARMEARRWNGSAPAPPPIKQGIVRGYARRHDLKVLVETGTYRGDMTASARWWAETIHTIEIDPALAAAARRRFKAWRKINVHEGDSAEVLPKILERLNAPTLFWLDAHYCAGVSGRADTDTPIARELELILPDRFARAILIDDARHFSQGDYPSIEHVEKAARDAGRSFEVDMDVIRIV